MSETDATQYETDSETAGTPGARRAVIALIILVVLVLAGLYARTAWINRLWGTWQTSVLGIGTVQIELAMGGKAAARFSSLLGSSDVALGTWTRDKDTIVIELDAVPPMNHVELAQVHVTGDVMNATYRGVQVELKRVPTRLME